MDELQKLQVKIEKARAAVKRAKTNLKSAKSAKDKAMRQRILKGMKTRLKVAEVAYKAAKPKSSFRKKAEETHDNLKDKGRRLPIKKVVTWTGLAITTVITAVGGFMLYEYLNKDGEAPAQDSV